MAKIDPALVEGIHQNLAQYARENYPRFYYLVYSYVKNTEVAAGLVRNIVFYSLRNARKLPALPPMRTWYFQLLMGEGMRAMRDRDYEREFTKDSQIYAYFETLEPSATNAFKLYYFEAMELDQVMGIMRMKADEVKSRLRFVRSKMEIDSSLDEESLERLNALLDKYESPEIPENLAAEIEERIAEEEASYAKYMEKRRKSRIIKPVGVVVLLLLFLVGSVNAALTQPGFAAAMEKVPLVGDLILYLASLV